MAYVNESGINGVGLPGLKLRKGIDTTWGNWYSIITNNATTTTANYVPRFSGTNGIINSCIYDNGNVGIGTIDPKAKLHVFGQENGAFNGLVIDNRKNYGSGTGISQTSRIVLSLTENGAPNPLDRIFGVIESGTLSESSSTEGRLSFYVRQGGSVDEKIRINSNGYVGIGTTTPDEKLTVKGKIHTQEVRVDLLGACIPDYVFANDYKINTLQEVEKYVKANSHLPEVPSALDIEKNGLLLGEMNILLLKKVEELTLYAIEQDKKAALQQQDLERLKTENENYKSLAERLSAIEKELKK